MNLGIESEEKFGSQLRVLFESSQAGILLIDPAGAIILANRRTEEMFGYRMDELLRLRYPDLVHPDQRNDGDGRMRRVIAGEIDRVETERHYLHKSGSDFWGYISVRRHEDSEGNLISLVGHITDMSELKQKEKLLEASEKKFRMLFEHSADPSLLLANNSFVDCNQAAVDILGAGSRAEILNTHPSALSPEYQPDGRLSAEKADEIIAWAIQNGSHRFEWMHRRMNGELFPVEVSLTLIQESEQAVLFTVWRDITERRRLEKKLHDTIDLFSLFMKHTPAYTFIKRIEGNQSRVIQASDNFIEMVGKPAEELHGRTMEEIFPADFARKITDDDIAIVKAGKYVQLDEEFNGRSYTTIKFPIIRDNSESLLAGFTLDITERRKIEEALYFTKISVENASDAIFWVTPDARIVDVNPAGCRLLGYTRDEMLSLSVHDIDPHYNPEVWQQHFPELRKWGTIHLETEQRAKNGSLVPVEIVANYVRLAQEERSCAFVRDISERKRAEAERLTFEKQLLQTQKLESLGVLAGGIAHDFNNILMAIIGNADLALMKVNLESPAVDNLRRIEQAAARAADLAKQMLAYSGKGKFVLENINLNYLLEEMLNMLEVSISKKAVLRFQLHTPLPTVEADATQIRQIIMNLVINSSEAIEKNNGFITITTGCMECDRSYLKDVWLDENLIDGLYVYLEISDTGCGMDKGTLSKLFDPFFTTKFTGRGLGMAAVLGIVRGHKGAIKVYSEPGRGSSFKILFPASSRPAEIIDDATPNNEWKGAGMVLLVDDEESVRGVGSEMLTELGYTPLTADNGREAVEALKKYPDISFVILDLTMPQMDGEQCFHELRRIRPDIRVLMSSGYNEQEVTQKFVGKKLAGFIQKPYRLSVLKEAIQGIENS